MVKDSTVMFGHIKCANYEKTEKFIIKIGESILTVYGRPGKWFTNITIHNEDSFELLEGDSTKVSLEKTYEKIYHPDQIAFDKKYKIQTHKLENEPVFYSLLGNTNNPQKILITFSGINNYDNVNHRLSALTSVQDKLSNKVLILAFQDKECVYGNYMYKTFSGQRIKPIVISLISGLIAKYQLKESDLIFYGNSKGGSVAIDYIQEYTDAHYFIDIPQIDLYNYESQNDLLRFSIGEESRKYYNYLNYFPTLNNKNVTYSFAENDFDASRGLKMLCFPGIKINMLKDMEHSNSAMELVKRQFSKIIQIANSSPPTIREKTSCNISINQNKLYFDRILGAFKSETDKAKLYAEINFIGKSNTYSISLNKKLHNGNVLVFWEFGFNIHEHLAKGTYELTLTVYYNFKEFIYPLSKYIVINEDIVIYDKNPNPVNLSGNI